MLQIIKESKEIEISFNGIKIFQTDNTIKLYKDIFVDSKIIIDNKSISSNDVIYISELTKLYEFISLGKKSFLFKEIQNLLDEYKIINNNNIEIIKNKINELLGIELLDSVDGDISKIISLILELKDDRYLDDEILDIILTKSFENSKLIVFDNVSWIKLSKLLKYINEHKIIILSNDFRNYIDSLNELELLVIFKNENDYIDILDKEKAIIYLEQNINEEINESKFKEMCKNKNNLSSLKMFFYLKNI